MSNTMDQDHEVIWLAPWCDDCDRVSHPGDGRTWCQDNVYDPCEECGREPVKYVLAGTQEQPARFNGEKAIADPITCQFPNCTCDTPIAGQQGGQT